MLGVSGHIMLNPEDLHAVKNAVKTELLNLLSTLGEWKLVICSGLARGSDQLVSKVALDLGLKIMAVLPMSAEAYRSDFLSDPNSLSLFDELIEKCEQVIELDFPKESDPDINLLRDQAYRNQGLFLVENCSGLLVLWDGASHTPGGCGTSLVVEACQGNFLFKSISFPRNSSPPLRVLPVRRADTSTKQ